MALSTPRRATLARDIARVAAARYQHLVFAGHQVEDGDLRRIEEELSDLLTAQVDVRVKKRVKRHGRVEELGELAIQFGSLDELNGLIDKLRA